MESRESWERRWQLAKQRTDAKIIELHQISGNVQVKIIAFYAQIFNQNYSKMVVAKRPFSKMSDVTLDYTIHHSL